MTYRTRTESSVLYGIAVATILGIAFPILLLTSLAFKSRQDVFASPPRIVFVPTLSNFQAVLSDGIFAGALQNSLLVSATAALASLALAIPAAYGLVHLQGKLRRRVLLWLLLTRMAPGMIFVIPYFAVYQRFNLVDTRVGLVLIYLVFNVPLAIWMLLPFFESVPDEVEDAALVDGANRWQTLRFVSLPLVRNGIAAAGILTFIFSWSEFLFALILTRRDATTAPVTIVNYMAYEGTEWGLLGAAGILILLPVLLLGFLVRRHLVSGMTAGAVKG